MEVSSRTGSAGYDASGASSKPLCHFSFLDKIELARQNVKKLETNVARRKTDRAIRSVPHLQNANSRETVGRFAYAYIAAAEEAFGSIGPFGNRCDVANKSLTAEIAPRVDMIAGQLKVVIDPGFMGGRTGDLEDLRAGVGLKHSVSNLGRLKNAISGFEPKGRTLAFVNNPDTARDAKDHLKPDVVVVNMIGDWTAFGQSNPRSDYISAKAIRY